MGRPKRPALKSSLIFLASPKRSIDSDDSPLVEMRMKAKEGERQCRAEKRAGNGNRSVQVEDDPWWAQIIERRLCENVVWLIGVL